MRALVVEDDFASRVILQRMLSSFFEVDIAVNGVEAVQAFERAGTNSHNYDLIFMDVMMPELDGLGALERIRSIERENDLGQIKVVMTTALSDMKTVTKAFHDGWANAYITKPIKREKLIEELQRLELISS